MKDLSDITPSDDTDCTHDTCGDGGHTPDSVGDMIDPDTVGCDCPHDFGDSLCATNAPTRGLKCSRVDGHGGAHVACGHLNCKYLIWTAEGTVLYDHHVERMEELTEGDG